MVDIVFSKEGGVVISGETEDSLAVYGSRICIILEDVHFGREVASSNLDNRWGFNCNKTTLKRGELLRPHGTYVVKMSNEKGGQKQLIVSIEKKCKDGQCHLNVKMAADMAISLG